MITYGSTTLTSYNSIVKTEVYYYKSTSATSLSGGSWSTTKPTWENGKYIWQKIQTVYEDGTHTESDPVNITGQQGATGTAAYSYKLNSSDSIIGKTKDGEYTIKKITFSATYKQGTGAVSAYSGRFKIESTTNGSTWKTEYTSSGNEASKEFTIPDDIIAIKCSLYQSDGTTVLLDIVTVPVVKDGVDAIGLRDSIPYYLASDKDTGITRLTQGWTRYRPQLTAEKKYLWVYYVSRYSEGSTEPELIEIKDDLVHLINNGDESPVESCVVDIDPVQDLNGYDHPWVGGAGKNLFDIDSAVDGFIAGNGSTIASPDANNMTSDFIPVVAGQTYTYTCTPTSTASPWTGYAFYSAKDMSTVVGTRVVVNALSATFTVPNGANYLRIGSRNLKNGNAQVEKGSVATEWEPYENICPITGWTAAQIWDDPKYGGLINWNQKLKNPHFDEDTNGLQYWTSTNVSVSNLEDGSVSLTITAVHETQSYYNLLYQSLATTTTKQHKFLILLDYKPAHTHNVPIFLMRSSGISGNYGQTINNIPAGKWNRLAYFVPAQDRTFHQLQFALNATVNSGYSVGDVDYIRYPQMFDLTEMFGAGNEPTTLDEFKALFPKDCYDYNSEVTCVSAVSGEPHTHVQVSWQSEVGTVYGGQLNVTTGELVVDRVEMLIDGFNIKTAYKAAYGTLNRFSILYPTGLTGKYTGTSTFCISDKLEPNYACTIGISQTRPEGYYTFPHSTAVMVSVPASQIDTVEAMNAWFTEHTPTVVYELATPITYQLTPQEITMLCKENNIFTDTGQTAISYYDNQTSTDPYVDYSLTSAFDASTIEPAYIETEWVESTGKQYVYLDWKPPIKTWGFEIDFISYNALGTTVGAWNEDTNKNGYGTIFGVRNASGVNNAQLSSYSNGLLRIGNGANQATGFKTNHIRQQIKLQNTTITKTDGTTSTVSRLDETANKPYCNMTVFGLHDGLRRAGNGGISEPSSTRIYLLKFYDGDTLTVDLVGAIRKRDSVTGLYDKVSKHFYPAPGMLFGDVVGDIGDSISMKEAMDKANPQTIVVNKDRTRMWEATVPFNDLQDGQKITVTYSYGNVVSSVETDELIGWDDTSNNQQVYLKLTFADGHKTDWIPCYYSNTSRLTTHYGAGIPIQLTYRENILANASETASGNMVLRGFYADANYDTNNTDIVRWSYGRVIAGSNKIFPYSIIMQNADERWESIVTSSTTAKTKTRNTHGFRLDTILYQAANTTTNENVENTSYQLRTGDPIMDMRYNLNIEDTAELRLVHGKSVYLVGTVGTDGLFYLADQWWSQSLPTTEDGKIYIFLGQVYDWYRCGLATMHPIYKFVDGKLKSTLQIAVDALDKAKEVAQDLADLGADLQAQIDGKIETWCQSTDPSTAWTTTELKNQHNGDLWYYTGESTSTYKNNTTYKYTASTNKWTAYSASTDLFDKIDAKTSIYYGKPSAVTQNLEVGDYLVDSTDGCSYRWDGSKWVKLTDYNAAIDEIEVGGRNLWKDSSLTGNISEYSYHTYWDKTIKDGYECLHYSGQLGKAYPLGRRTTIPDFTPWAGLKMVISCDVLLENITRGTTNYFVGFYMNGETIDGHWTAPTIIKSQNLYGNSTNFDYVNLPNKGWQRAYLVFEFGDYNWSTKNWTFTIYNRDFTGDLYIKNVKVEFGNMPTDWTPAPEDTEAEISAAQTTADTALDRATATCGTCSTDSTVDAKVVVCPDFVLFEGARIQVTFTNANTASAPTLNINNTGAKAIYINKTAASNTNQLLWTAGSKMEFVYDGTGWIAQNVPYALYGTCSTGASTAAKAITCNEAVICKGTTISVNMTNTNTAANATMNVGSTLAKDIYANGAKLTTNSRFNWRANTTQKFVFDGQVWRMDDDSVKALATAYITEIDDDGIMVHPEDDSTSGWAISDAIQLFKSGISYIKLWIENNIPKIRIGKEDQGHIILDNDSVDVRDGDDVLATFGENTRIGTEDGTYLSLSTEGLIGSKNNLQYMQFLANGKSQTYGHVISFSGGYSDSPQTYTHRISINESIEDYIIFNFKADEGLYSFTQQLEIKDSEETYTFVDQTSRYQVITRFISNSKYMTCYQTLTRLNSQAPKVRCTFRYIVTEQKQSPTFTLGTRVENSDQGLWSYAEGLNNIASGDFSYVEGENNTASGSYAHAEGKNVTASGLYSHAGGDSTISNWAYTFVHGHHLISNDEAQAVFGQYNKRRGRTTYLFILGNGTADDDNYRSDAFIVDDTGNIFLDINSSASSGTTDAKLYDAITALGWQNDIINNI